MSKTAKELPENNSSEEKAKKKKPRFRILRWLVLIPIFLIAAAICGASVIFVIFAECSKDLPNVEKLKFYSPSETTTIYSSEGEVLATLYKENREWVPYDKIPKHMIDAIIAIEDSRFYEHKGISYKDIIRAIWIDMRERSGAQGASTITQQLARNIFLHPSANLRRKVREALLAVEIEKRFTKREILELYLNQIYFGAGSYGVQAAAKTYYGKNISDLDLAQCAIIAGLPAAPTDYSPFEDKKLAKERQILVLKRMYDLGYIDYKSMKQALDEKLVYVRKKTATRIKKYPYFTDYALHELFQKYPDDLIWRGGLKVYTTVDLKMQKQAEQCVKDGIARAEEQGLNCHQAAMVVVEPKTGFIKSMVGGTGWTEKNQFNRAWQARRQPGSSFKIFVYTAAIDAGFTPDTIIPDSPASFPDGPGKSYTPLNSDGKYMGSITMRQAIQWSRNVCAVRVMERVGPEKVIQYAYKMGVKDRLEPNLSLALGAGVVTPLDMASAIAVLANEGIRVEPTSIRKIVDSEGNIIEDNTYPSQEVVIPATTAYAMTDMLKDVVSRGTATNAQIGRPAAGKTGTTDSHRDAWFVGYTPELAAAVWTGNDDYAQMYGAFGGNIPASIWGNFMKSALAGTKPKDFHNPKIDAIALLICDDTGLLATGGCPHTHKEFFRHGKAPTRYCTMHGDRVLNTEDKSKPGKKAETYKPEVHEEDLLPPEDFAPRKEPAKQSEPDIIIDEKPIEAPAEKPEAPKPPPAPQGQTDL
ncbi:MAG: penicillin-binding protein 1A [Firmicutes bacterium]|nr:penicillin-binding protein 1A [Bacillota bacterium]